MKYHTKTFFLIGFIFLLTSSPRFTLAFLGLVCSVFLFQTISLKLSARRFYYLAIMFAIILSSTFLSVYFYNIEFSVWQILRSQIGTIIFILLLVFLDRRRLELGPLFLYSKVYLVIVVPWCLLDIFFKFDFSPSLIRTISGDRIYPVGFDFFVLLSPLFLMYKKYMIYALSVLILILTQSKALLLLFLFVHFYFLFNSTNRAKYFVSFFTLFLIMIFFMRDRIDDLLVHGDVRRMQQIIEGLDVFLSSFKNVLVGIGLGTKYSDGYLSVMSNITTLTPQIVNSFYDIENGFIYLLVRFGLLGTIVFFLLVFSVLNRNRFFYISVFFILFLGMSPVGYHFPLTAFAFIYLNRFYFK